MNPLSQAITNNPYLITEPAAISFSGGRTSGYMLYKIIEAHGGTLPDYLKVTFANTGKEMPATLDFVQACSDQWGIDIVWLECKARKGNKGPPREGEKGENKYVYETIITDYENASREGEPFSSLIAARNYLPNPVARFCTQELKILRIRDYMTELFPDIEKEKSWINVIGIRADEPRRYIKSNSKNNVMPLYHTGVTKHIVSDFWKSQSFDLELPNNNGVTDWGNCDLCFLKGAAKKLSIIRERPDLVDWWKAEEEKIGQPFRLDHLDYAAMKVIASNQPSMELGDDETIPCYCGD